MPFELRHAERRRLVALAEALAAEIAPRAAEHDRDGELPFESIAALKQSGYFAAPIPEQLGGLGVTRCTTCSSPRAGSPAATRRWRSASTCTSSSC